jgi:hypothetical protein
VLPTAVVAALLVAATTLAPGRVAAAPLRGPVGWESLGRPDLLPLLRDGTRMHGFSSHDRTGGNDDGLLGTYSCLRHSGGRCVIAEHRGAGELETIWTTRDFGNLRATGGIRIRLDGRTVVDAPLDALVFGRVGSPFVFPLVADPGRSSGGAYVRVPMPFRRSMEVTTDNQPGYYNVMYRTFADGSGVRRFDPRQRAAAVLRMLRAAGDADPKPSAAGTSRVRRSLTIPRGGTATLASLRGGGVVRSLGLRLRGADEVRASAILQRARLRLSFDGRRTVDAPLGEFLGSGLGLARVRSLLFAMGPSPDDWLRSWWPMPYARSASIALVNRSDAAIRLQARVRFLRSTRWARLVRDGRAGVFHATSRRPTRTVRGRDWTFLHVRGAGTLAGVTQTMRGGESEYYLEGDEHISVDGSRRPQMTGTGTEDFYGGGWYFTVLRRSTPFSLPFNGFPKELDRSGGCPDATCKTAYRVLLADSVPFRRSIRFGIEHGAENETEAVYSSTAYWYGR